MFPIATVQGVKDGISTGMIIDLTEYLKKKEGATKVELQELTNVVATKLDAEPQHKHHIDDIKQLQSLLESKFDKGEKYSFNTIISDIDKIPYIESPKIKMLNIGDADSENPYTIYVDDASGDLMIVLDGVLIGSYSKSANKWNLIGLENDISLDEYYQKSEIDTKIAKINEILANHYQALVELCEKHGMIDSDTNDGTNITPE